MNTEIGEIKQIETERLIARPFSADDLDMIFRLYSDEEILRYTPFDIMDMESARRHLEGILQDWAETSLTDLEFLIVSKEDGRKTGRCGIHIDTGSDSAMIGWFLPQEEWGKGYATELTKAMLDFCFCTLGVHRAYALCNPENKSSVRVLEKKGMRKEAHLRKKCRYTKNGVVSWHDELVFAILREEYLSGE